MNPIRFLVRSHDISATVAVNSGINGNNRIERATGTVLKPNGTYVGFALASLWEWLAIKE